MEGLLFRRAKITIIVMLNLLGITIIPYNYVYACSLILREDVMHKPSFMLEVYPTAYNNVSIEEAFMLLNKVYADLTDSPSNDRIPYYVEAELTPSADGYGEYTLLIYYYDHEQKYAERLDVGESMNHVRASVAFNLIMDLNPDCSTLPAEHRFFTMVESLKGSTLDTIKRFNISG
ncbi:MAG: hypothetical protein ACK4FV_04370 [Candidatus Nitrosocaldus sp.]